MKIGIIGSGYVGLVTGVCFSHLGHKVICVDNDLKKIALLRRKKSPIYEPGLEEMIQKNVALGRLRFSTSIAEAVRYSEVLFICVNTPPKEDGDADLSYVENVSAEIAKHLRRYRLIVEKSTVPVQTGEWIARTIRAHQKRSSLYDVASNPEFLREGSAIKDFLEPDRIVLGVSTERAEKILRKIYEPLGAPIVVTDLKSAELIKHASNSFLATKISFINMVGRICEAVGADVDEVARGMGLDPRIGPHFLKAGVGFGGFCFPKDLAAFVRMSERLGISFGLLREVLEINEQQKRFFIQKIQNVLWNLNNKTLGILGLSFKPNTDDMRFAPSVDIIQLLQAEGARIQAYDPQAMQKARGVLKGVRFRKSPYEVAYRADGLIVLTEWDEFATLDFRKIKKLMKRPILFDGRNFLNPVELDRLGFTYVAVGKPLRIPERN